MKIAIGIKKILIIQTKSNNNGTLLGLIYTIAAVTNVPKLTAAAKIFLCKTADFHRFKSQDRFSGWDEKETATQVATN